MALWDPPFIRSEPPTQEPEVVESESEDDSEDMDAALLLFGMQVS